MKITHRVLGSLCLLFAVGVVFFASAFTFLERNDGSNLPFGIDAQTFVVVAGIMYSTLVLGLAFYLKRHVIDRIKILQFSMTAFVEGKEARIPTEGTDEVASMGRALDYLVTTLHRREERLEEQLNFQRTLLDTIPNPIFYKDNDGRFLVVNAAFESVVGLQPEDIVGKTSFDIDRPDLSERYDREDREKGDGKRRYSYEAIKTYADGRPHHVMIEKAHFINSEGKAAGVAAVMVDITRLKDAELELQSAKEQAEAANLAKSSFLAAMSHEIRTPMNGVLGMVELLEHTQLLRDQRNMLKTVKDSAVGLLTIIDDILDFSKIEAGRMDLEKVDVNVESLVNGVAETLAPSVRKRGRDVGLIAFIDPDVPTGVLADPVRVRQILMNLAGNAIKFTESGRVYVTATVAKSEENETTIRFDVTDTGIGISKEHQEKLFEAFTQAEGSITRRFGGTGLGLSISKRLVHLMNGKIAVDSALGQGSTFWFEIPFDVSKHTNEVASNDTSTDVSGCRVLTCLSDPTEREFIERYLDAMDVTYDTAETVGYMLNRCSLADVVIYDTWPGSGGGISELESAIKLEVGSIERPGHIQLHKLLPQRTTDAKPDNHVSLLRPFDRGSLTEAVGVAAGQIQIPVLEINADHGDTIGEANPPTVEDAKRKGQLILAVEDHPVNRLVLQRQLHTLGYAVEVAENGLQALEMWRSGAYALVLTDCHMPEMDGYELTAAIRAEENSAVGRTPIIAATANALEGEADACMRAGMDGYLSKPINLDALSNELSKWISSDDSPTTSEARNSSGTSVFDSSLDLSVLRGICHNDDDAVQEMLQVFLEINDKVFEDLKLAVADNDAEKTESLAHKLKGSAGTAGAKPLAELAKTIEKHSSNRDWDEIAALTLRLDVEYQRLRSEIGAVL